METRKGFGKFLGFIHRSLLVSTEFTIISNNCWGGVIYKYFGLKFQSPTVGMYFFSDEYIKFLKNFDYYIQQPLIVRDSTSSKYKEELLRRGQNPLIGWLDDVEIVLLHYHDVDDAIRKWEYRRDRIDRKCLIFKFNDQNLCSEQCISEFDKLNFANKICFTGRNYPEYASTIFFKEYAEIGYVQNDTKMRHWRRYFNVIRYINSIQRK